MLNQRPRVPFLVSTGALISLVLVLSLSACSSNTSSVPGVKLSTTSSPGGSAAASCATRTTVHAEAWVTGQQVSGTIGGAATAVLSNFHYPLGIPDEGAVGNAPYPAFITISPDAQHLAVEIAQVEPFSVEYNPYIVDTSTHAVIQLPSTARIMVASEAAPQRILAWADNHTLLIFSGSGSRGSSSPSALSYDVTTGTLTSLTGLAASPVEGEVRCGTLYYLSYTAFSPIPGDTSGNHYQRGSGLLHRYNLSTHTEIGSPISLGDISTYGGAEGQIIGMGWDVSADGSQLVYQDTAATLGGSTGLITASQFFAANSDGSNSHQILNTTPVVTSNDMTYITISPDGSHVAVTNANPTPNIATDSLSGGSVRVYSPDAIGQPAWLADGSGFDVSQSNIDGTPQNMYRYLLSTPPGSAGRVPGSIPFTGMFPASNG